MESNFICLIDANIEKISDVPLSDRIKTLNLHCNKIRLIGPAVFPNSLINLDLSSNFISTFCCGENLQNLKWLNLSANRIKAVKNFKCLSSLVHLDLSYNQLTDLSDLRGVHGHPLLHLDVRGNRLASVDNMIWDLSEFKCLKDLLVSDEPLTVADNPLCTLVDFRMSLFEGLPQILTVDSYFREVPTGFPHTAEAGCTFWGNCSIPCKTKYSCGVQTENEGRSETMKPPASKTVRHIAVQVVVNKREKQKLALQLAKITTELNLERSLRAKSETLQECLINKLEELGERNNQNSDLVLANCKLKEQLDAETRNRGLLENHLAKIFAQMQGNIQSFDEVVTLIIDCNRLHSDMLVHLKADSAAREFALRKSLQRTENRKLKRLLQDRIARAYKEVQSQADSELKAAQERYAQLEAEFRFALHSESQRYNQILIRARTAEKALQEQEGKLRAEKENLNLAAFLVGSLKKTIADQWKELHGSDRSLSNTRDLLVEMNKTIKQLTAQLSAEKKEKSQILEEHKACWDLNNAVDRMKEENKKLKKLQGKIANNNSALSNEITELTAKLKLAEESVRIKTIQLDDQLDTIKRLKCDLNTERDKNKELAKVEDENKQLQSTIGRLTDRKDELKSLAFQLQTENDSLKDQILAHREEVNHAKEKLCCKDSDWSKRCAQAESERDEAVSKMREMSERMKEVERRCKSQLESAENALREQEREANQRLLETQEAANQRIHQVEEEMRRILLESMSLRERVETTMKQLAGELGYQGD